MSCNMMLKASWIKQMSTQPLLASPNYNQRHNVRALAIPKYVEVWRIMAPMVLRCPLLWIGAFSPRFTSVSPIMLRCRGSKKAIGQRRAYVVSKRAVVSKPLSLRRGMSIRAPKHSPRLRIPSSAHPMLLAPVGRTRSCALNKQHRMLSMPPMKSFHPVTVGKKVKDWFVHFWMGCKQFAKDVRVAWAFMRRVMQGDELTRQERRQVS